MTRRPEDCRPHKVNATPLEQIEEQLAVHRAWKKHYAGMIDHGFQEHLAQVQINRLEAMADRKLMATGLSPRYGGKVFVEEPASGLRDVPREWPRDVGYV